MKPTAAPEAAPAPFAPIAPVVPAVEKKAEPQTRVAEVPPPPQDASAQVEKEKRLAPGLKEAQTLRAELEKKKKAPPGMVFVKGGCFDMGDTFGDGEADERPVHRVCLDDFWMDKYEVTNAQFENFKPSFRESRNAEFKEAKVSPGDKNPVVMVTWDEAVDYCASVGKRLPTEAEWEYAARGGLSGKRYVWGNSTDEACRYADVADWTLKRTWADYKWETFTCDDGYFGTAPTGAFQANGYGLHDMAGNVWEWVNDWRGKDYYAQSPERNPKGPSSGPFRVLRGGSWAGYPSSLRVSFRHGIDPTTRSTHIGVRCSSN